MSEARARFVVKWTRQPPALFMLLKREWEGQRRVERVVWVCNAVDGSGFLSVEDAWGAFDRNEPGPRCDYDVRPQNEELATA